MSDRLPDINLLPKYERERVSVFYLFIALTLITLLSYVLIGFFYFSTKSKLDNAEAEYTELDETARVLRAQLEETETNKGNLDKAVVFADNFNIPTSFLVDELVNLLPEFSYLSEYQYRGREVDLKTHFEVLDDTANYTSNLLTSNFIKDTKVDYIRAFSLKDEEEEPFSTIPRYEASFILNIDAHTLKGASEEDE